MDNLTRTSSTESAASASPAASAASGTGGSSKKIIIALLVVALAAGCALFFGSGGSLSGLFKGSFNAPVNNFVVTLDSVSKDANGLNMKYTISNETGSTAPSGFVVRLAADSASATNVLLAEKLLDSGATNGTQLRNLESVTYSTTIPAAVFPSTLAIGDVKSVTVKLINDMAEFGSSTKSL